MATKFWTKQTVRTAALAAVGGAMVFVSVGYAQHHEGKQHSHAQMVQSTVTVYATDADKEKFSLGIPASIPLADAMQREDKKAPVCVSAKVVDVCQKKGCWMILTDGEHSVRVTFKDYAFFVPKDIVGKTVQAQGVIGETVLSEADARHYAEDAGASAEEIEAIVGDQKEWNMVANVVFIAKQ